MAEFVYPCAVRAVSDNFQAHKNRGSVNPGTDFMAGYGTPVYAVAAGTVTDSDNSNGGSGGRTIHIDHDNGWGSDYLHLSSFAVRVGQRVAQGQLIGYSGASGEGQDHYYGAHLHLSLRPNHDHGYGGRGNVDPETKLSNAPVVTGDPATLQRQQFLNVARGEKLAVDGVQGPATTEAIKRYQTFLRSYGYTGAIDGSWGNGTQAAHDKYYAVLHAPAPAPAAGRPVVKRGSTGQPVKDVQWRLRTNYPLYAGTLSVDGDFGPATEAAVKEFQRRSGLTADGIVGPATYRALGIS